MPRMYFRANLRGLMWGDFKTTMEGFKSAIESGIYPPDRCLQLLDENALPDGEGAFTTRPANFTTAAELAAKVDAIKSGEITVQDIMGGAKAPTVPTPPESAPAPPEDQERAARIDAVFGDLFAEALRRLARIESDKATRALKRPKEYMHWVDEFYIEHRERVAVEIGAVVAAYREALGKPWTAGDSASLASAYCESLRAQLRTADLEKIGHEKDWLFRQVEASAGS